ncbi:MAG: hypothetical protein HYR85_13445, partial [Planctomycetes bacterium]|nr:hypothetical protein [Planctomycetota bacterium]
TFGLVLVTAVSALELGTHGEFFRNVVVGNAAPLSLSHVWKTGGKALLAGLAGTSFAIALGAVVRRDSTSIVLRTWLAVALGVGLFSLAKTGSDENYLIEASVPAAGLAALVMVGNGRRLALRVAIAAVWGAIAVTMEHRSSESSSTDSRDRALEALRDAPPPVWVQSPELAVACGKPVVMLDTYNFRLLEEAGVFDPGALADRFNRRDFRAVLLDFDPFVDPRVPTYQGAPRVSPAFVDAMRENYRESARIGRYRLLVPITAPAGR